MVGDYGGLLQMIADQKAQQELERKALDDSVLGGLQDVRQGVSAPVEPAEFYKDESGVVPYDQLKAYLMDSEAMVKSPYGYEVYGPQDQSLKEVFMYDRPSKYPYSNPAKYVSTSGEFAKKGK